MDSWLVKNQRIVIVGGDYNVGRRGRLIRSLGGDEWMVHLDDKFFGTTVKIKHMRPER